MKIWQNIPLGVCVYLRTDASAHRLSVAQSQRLDSGKNRDREKLISQLEIECPDALTMLHIWQIEIHIERPFS
jgi:hypothetical protein